MTALGAYSLTIPSSQLPDSETLARVSGVTALAAGVVFVVSAVTGFSATSKCQ